MRKLREFASFLVSHVRSLVSRLVSRLTPTSPVAELARLNDNLESIMLHYHVPRYTRAEMSAPPVQQSTVFQYDEQEAAYTEWREEYDQARGRMTASGLDDPSDPGDAE